MTAQAARLLWVTVRGFRAFGTEPRRLELDAPLIVVHAGNSQGKTSLAEALEFLITGRSSRRDLLGGAKAEYAGSLRNAHLPEDDQDVYIEAGIAGSDGVVHQVRRELLHDFGHGTECASRLLVDGIPVEDLAAVGLPMSDPPVRAPVLLQHILRDVLSTEPKQRVGYFKALLSLTDLDLLHERVVSVRSALEREAPGFMLAAVAALSGTPASVAASRIQALTDSALGAEDFTVGVNVGLLDAGGALLGTPHVSLADLQGALQVAIAEQNEESFPLNAFTATTLADAGPCPDLAAYSDALDNADREAARLAPLFTAVLAVEEFAELEHPVDCPVCATPDALSPARIGKLRDQLRRSTAVDTAAAAAGDVISRARQDLDRLRVALPGTVPAAGTWSPEQLAVAAAQLRRLDIDAALAAPAQATAARLAASTEGVMTAIEAAKAALDRVSRAIKARKVLPDDLGDSYITLTGTVKQLQQAGKNHYEAFEALRGAVEPAIRHRVAGSGFAELLHLITNAEQLVEDLVAEAGRQQTVKRLKAAEQALGKGAGRVLDTRFGRMSKAIDGWWSSIRPDELVGFGGVRRRAGGARFVNLDATLRSAAAGNAVIRDALGVYSDSQLNALGLSIFLARAELLGSCVVVLDDPIPGSDSDHRLTFVQNTLGRLLDTGTQVILTTFDGKLADWALSNHDHRGLVSYQLTLSEPSVGSYPTQTSDAFNRLLLEAEDNLYAPTPRGRRAACGSYRAAAERLAKQIVATGRSHDGNACTVADIHAEAPMLNKLVPLVRNYALDNAENGQWRTFAKVLNPGNHDDDVPSTTELKQVRGSLRRIAKTHREHWPNGLLV